MKYPTLCDSCHVKVSMTREVLMYQRGYQKNFWNGFKCPDCYPEAWQEVDLDEYNVEGK
jgi:hypothetical protein